MYVCMYACDVAGTKPGLTTKAASDISSDSRAPKAAATKPGLTTKAASDMVVEAVTDKSEISSLSLIIIITISTSLLSLL